MQSNIYSVMHDLEVISKDMNDDRVMIKNILNNIVKMQQKFKLNGYSEYADEIIEMLKISGIKGNLTSNYDNLPMYMSIYSEDDTWVKDV